MCTQPLVPERCALFQISSQRSHRHVRTHAGAYAPRNSDPAEPQLQQAGSKKRRRSPEKAEEDDVDEEEEAVPLFWRNSSGSGRAQRKGEKHESAAPAVATGDPFEAANVLRKQHRIKVAGGAAPAPLGTFAELRERHAAPPRLLENLGLGGFAEPTPIQRQAIPALLDGRELLAVAPTGRHT
jgi:ATP-dependent RNA helicase DDX52/ROK1